MQHPPTGLGHQASAIQVLEDQAVALHFRGETRAAENAYSRLLEREPANFRVLSAFGVLAAQTERHQLAVDLFKRAIAANPREPILFNNLGIAWTNLLRYEEATACFDHAISLAPNYADAYSNRGVAQAKRRLVDHALADFDRSIALNPQHSGAHYHKALTCLLLGDFRRGWPLYEWRKKLPRPAGVPQGMTPVWGGEASLAGKTLFVHAEQGLGDTIHFCRYAYAAAELAAHVVLGVPAGLCRLLRGLGSRIEIIDQAVGAPSADYQVALMSLPLALADLVGNMGASEPYLFAERDRIAQWHRRIGDHGFKIGVRWITGPGNSGRCFAPSSLRSIARIPGVRLFDLQRTCDFAQPAELPSDMRWESFGEQLDSGPDAFIDTAAIMNCMDLIITADTATAHLAGALGRRTWIVLEFVPDWRWMLEGSDTLWYDTARLFRQNRPGDWESLFETMQTELLRGRSF